MRLGSFMMIILVLGLMVLIGLGAAIYFGFIIASGGVERATVKKLLRR